MPILDTNDAATFWPIQSRRSYNDEE